jgi:hypothetical protein
MHRRAQPAGREPRARPQRRPWPRWRRNARYVGPVGVESACVALWLRWRGPGVAMWPPLRRRAGGACWQGAACSTAGRGGRRLVSPHPPTTRRSCFPLPSEPPGGSRGRGARRPPARQGGRAPPAGSRARCTGARARPTPQGCCPQDAAAARPIAGEHATRRRCKGAGLAAAAAPSPPPAAQAVLRVSPARGRGRGRRPCPGFERQPTSGRARPPGSPAGALCGARGAPTAPNHCQTHPQGVTAAARLHRTACTRGRGPVRFPASIHPRPTRQRGAGVGGHRRPPSRAAAGGHRGPSAMAHGNRGARSAPGEASPPAAARPPARGGGRAVAARGAVPGAGRRARGAAAACATARRLRTAQGEGRVGRAGAGATLGGRAARREVRVPARARAALCGLVSCMDACMRRRHVGRTAAFMRARKAPPAARRPRAPARAAPPQPAARASPFTLVAPPTPPRAPGPPPPPVAGLG